MNKQIDYRKLWEKIYGPIPKDPQGRSYEIHHIDGNRENNCIENLRCISIEEHYKIHLEQGDVNACHAIKIRMSEESNLIGWKQPEEVKNKISKTKKELKEDLTQKSIVKRSQKGRKEKFVTGKLYLKWLKPVKRTEVIRFLKK